MDETGFDMHSLIPVSYLRKMTDFAITPFANGEQFGTLKRYNYFSILLVDRGHGTLTRDGVRYDFAAPCLICFSLYQPFSVQPKEELQGKLINFHPNFFCLYKHRREVSCNGVLFNNLYDTPVVKLNAHEYGSLQTIARQMQTESERQNSDPDVILSYLKIFLIEASRSKQDMQGAAKPTTLSTQLEQAIDSHFKTLRMPSDYGELLHISTQALNKQSKQFFHKNLTRLIAERMAIEAKRELYLTAKPIKQIAYELGFSDEFYFSRYFKKNTGVSPQVFRQTVGFDKMK
jgi:AraC-like DNA-binding protein